MLEQAESLGRDTLERFERVFGPQHGNVSSALSSLAQTLRKLGRAGEAEQELRRAIEIATAAYGADSPAAAGHQTSLAEILDDLGRAGEAETLLRRLIEAWADKLPPEDRRVTNPRVELGRALTLLGRFEEAERELLAVEATLSTAANVSAARRKSCLEKLVALYEAWPAVDAQRATHAASWRAKLGELP
jgi:serine/threonine-protein kinase